MAELRKPIPVKEAIDRVWEQRRDGYTEYIAITDCDNRRLAEDVVASHPVPSFPKSPYDGFAIRSEDTQGAGRNQPVSFKVIEHIGAGQVPEKQLHKGEATRIMTGAQIPAGADCITMFEICQTYENDEQPYMSIKRKMDSGQNIIEEGSEVAKGELLIPKGTIINPGVKAVLATFGYSEVKVSKKPVVGIIATGTELLDVDEELQPGKIRNSNAYMIASQITRSGADYRYFGKLKDEFEASYETVFKAMDEVDILITTGGVSVGDFDFMPAIYDKLGAEVLFNKVAMRPGSVTTAAVFGDKLLYGLSGNPSACYVGFELFVRPLLQHSLSNQNPFLRRVKAELLEEFPKANPFTRFVRSSVTYENGRIHVQPSGIDKSNVVTSLAYANALMVLPGGTRGFRAGDEVEVLLLEDQEGQGEF
ncbi:molybdopterin molybdotransferase MoeA [Lentibacillus juripiscarius]|uniref:Molybdopterin molybdenumtransferase n=1 Tax=Lentibacillus juripiscarius TaxID=257446 RepID=A0ABW5VBF1_9BACI